jgi:TP901 family phage tail tape measure protein
MANTEKIIVQVVVKGQKDLNNLDKNTNKATKSVGGLTKGIGRMAAQLTAAVVAFKTVTGAISSVMRSFKDFEFQMAKVRAITGANNVQFHQLTKSAQDLGRSTFFTAKQVAELQANFGKLGFSTSEILNAQEATLALAVATDSDLARAATVAGASVRGFGLSAAETARVTDVMALSFTSSAMDIEKFQTSMTKVAPISAAANISIEATTAVMSKLADTGIEASIAGTSLRNILLKMQDSTSDLSKSLGFTVNSSEDLMRALKVLNARALTNEEVMRLVDIRQVAAFNTMIRGVDSIEKLKDSFDNANGALEGMVKIIEDNLEGDLKKLTSAFDGLKQEVGEGLSPTTRQITQDLTSLINKLTDNADVIVGFFDNIYKGLKRITVTPLLKDLTTLKNTLNSLTGTEGWREFLELVGIVSPKNNIQRQIIERQAEYNKQLAKTIDLVDSSEKVTKANIDVVNKEIKQREEEIALLEKEEEIQNSTYQGRLTNLKLRPQEIARLKEEIKQLEENLLVRKDHLFEFQNINKATKVNTEETEKNTKAKIKNTFSDELRTEAMRDYLDIMRLVEDGVLSLEEAEEALRLEKIKALEDELNALPQYVMNAEMRLELEKRIMDLKRQGFEEGEQQIRSEREQLEDLGKSLIDIAGDEEELNEVRKIGVQISAAVQAAKSLELLQDKLIELQKYKTAIATGVETKATIAKTGADAAGSVAKSANMIPPANLFFIASTIAALVGAFASIRALGKTMGFAKGGMIEEFANGGMVHGKSHAFGGEKFAVGGRVVELEGGEAVINKRSTAMFKSQLSAMNSAGGGVKFADGGLLNMPSFTQQQFNAVGQNQMMGAVSQGSKVVVVESDITQAQQSVSVIESQVTF